MNIFPLSKHLNSLFVIYLTTPTKQTVKLCYFSTISFYTKLSKFALSQLLIFIKNYTIPQMLPLKFKDQPLTLTQHDYRQYVMRSFQEIATISAQMVVLFNNPTLLSLVLLLMWNIPFLQAIGILSQSSGQIIRLIFYNYLYIMNRA